MKKRVLMILLAVCLMIGIFMGCGQSEDVIKDAEEATDIVSVEVIENETTSESGDESEAVTAQTCSLCEVEKECGSYEVDGQTYIVCDDCYNEFATAFEIPRECSLCEVEKVCYGYIVDDQTYIVCNDCYGEFATAFDLKQLCGHCEEEKICSYYTIDGVMYVVCDDCYDEFVEGFGLK